MRKTSRTKEARDFIKDNYKKYTYKAIGKMFNLSLRSVQVIAWALGLSKYNRQLRNMDITKDKLKAWILKGFSVKDIAKHLKVNTLVLRQFLSKQKISIVKIKKELYFEYLDKGLNNKELVNLFNITQPTALRTRKQWIKERKLIIGV